LEFLYYLKKDSIEEVYRFALPDTSVWSDYGDTLRFQHYLRYPGYRYYPVVGVSFEQANMFCKWRGDIVTQLWRDNNPDSANTVFKYRRPTNEEWEFAARGNLESMQYPYGVRSINDRPQLKNDSKFYFDQLKGDSVDYKSFRKEFNKYRKEGLEPVFNITKKSLGGRLISNMAPIYIYTLPKNDLGLYNMIGNVAEMTSEKGIAKGGSWAHDLEGSRIDRFLNYKRPEAWLGFRCVCEIIRSKK
jgi:formylglycine-generating enzyme required for sulfatase activity